MAEVEGWMEYRKLILAELERLSRDIAAGNAKLDELRLEVAMLKIKAGFWGALAGSVPAVAAALWVLSK